MRFVGRDQLHAHGRHALAAMAAMAALVVVSCGAQARTTSTEPDPNGHAYDLVSVTGFSMPANTSVRVVFDGFSVHVSGACNTMSGDYHIAAGLLIVPSLSSTAMACVSPAKMAVDDHLAALLSASPHLQLHDGLLTISSATVSLELRETTAPADLPLEGTLWTVTGVGNGDSVARDNSVTPATVRLHDGVADVFAGCNTGRATATVRSDGVHFAVLTLGKKSCPAPQLQLEFDVVLTLRGVVTARVEGRSLVMASGVHSLLLEGASG